MINPLGPQFPPLLQANAMQRPLCPVRTMESPEEWQPMRWLLVPPGTSGSTQIGRLRIWLANARIEELENKPLYRPLVNTNRCVVRFSWFYEWRHEADGGKQRFCISLREERPMLLPGLYRVATIEGAPCPTFTVCTMEAQGIMRHIHNSRLRQPVVVDEEGAAVWLDSTLSLDAARAEVLSRECSREFEPDPPLQRDLFGNLC